MLCPTCHTLIDKNADEYPKELLLKWKRDHQLAISKALLCPVFTSRAELRPEIRKLLARNKEIFWTYGPYSAVAAQPVNDAAAMWNDLVISNVIPNNRKVAALVSANDHLLNESERETAQEFFVHVKAFEYNHLSGDKTTAAPLFPDSMNNILGEDAH